jgi:GTP-binding protein
MSSSRPPSRRDRSVALVGRANTGKSTLFNRLIEEERAVVTPIAGTTRDVNVAAAIWRGVPMIISDTVGLDIDSTSEVEEQALERALGAARDAAVIVQIVDGQVGLTPFDKQITKFLRSFHKPLLVAVNKVDSPKIRGKVDPAFFQLHDDVMILSAIQGSGVGDLLDRLTCLLPSADATEEDPDEIRLALVGRPNVGKSSLFNVLIGEERSIVSEQPHTTRDTQDAVVLFDHHKIRLVDTAGMRKRGHVGKTAMAAAGGVIERESVKRSLIAIQRADVIGLVLNIREAIHAQDRHLAETILNYRKSLFLIANQWDLIPQKNTETIHRYTEYLQAQLPFLTWAPILFTSATKKIRVREILELAVHLHRERHREISDSDAKMFIQSVISKKAPLQKKGVQHPRIIRFRQTRNNPPMFLLRVAGNQELHPSYLRFLEHQLREQFGFLGTPLTIRLSKG